MVHKLYHAGEIDQGVFLKPWAKLYTIGWWECCIVLVGLRLFAYVVGVQ
jgi:hypothetical protein